MEIEGANSLEVGGDAVFALVNPNLTLSWLLWYEYEFECGANSLAMGGDADLDAVFALVACGMQQTLCSRTRWRVSPVSWNAPDAGNCEQHAAACLQVLPEAVRGLLILKHMCLYSYCTRLCVMKLKLSPCERSSSG
jgi:hypothetical protein